MLIVTGCVVLCNRVPACVPQPEVTTKSLCSTAALQRYVFPYGVTHYLDDYLLKGRRVW